LYRNRKCEIIVQQKGDDNMKCLKIIRGNDNLIFEGITNIAELKNFAMKKSKEYENIVVAEDNYKQCEKTIKEIKPYRSEIKKYRAALNKELNKKSRAILDEIDGVTNIFSEVIDPVSEKIEEYKEKLKQEKIQKKKQFIQPSLDEMNEDLKVIYSEIPFFEFEEIQFLEEWENKKISDIIDALNAIVDTRRNEINSKLDRIDNAKAQSEILKLKLDLKTDVNYMQLKQRLYEDTWKEQLEELAFSQQEIEVNAVLKEQEEAILKQEIKEKKEVEKHEAKSAIDNDSIDIRLFLNEYQKKLFKGFLKENKIKFEMI
jgi:hypothetical protein